MQAYMDANHHLASADDVPKCGDGVPGCALENGTWVHTITGVFSITGKPSFFFCMS